LGLEDFDGVLFDNVGFGEVLVIIKVDEVRCSVVLASLAVFWTISSEVSYFSALETCI